MSVSVRARRRLRGGEVGQVFVIFALLLPVLLALGSVVIALGNIYVHKRHLQTQVDAAAFAGGTKFTGCNPLFNPSAANMAIKAAALEYAGDTIRTPATIDPTLTAPVRNPQVQEPNDVRIALNSATYWDPPNGFNPTGGYGLDDTIDPDGNPLTPGDHCTTKALDVKGTDQDAPLIWGLIPFSPSPKAKARVEILQILEQAGMLPFAVPEIDPAAVVALFVNEDGASPITPYDSQDLVPDTTPPDNSFSYFTTAALQELVNVPSENTGVVILISRNDSTPNLSGDLATICGQDPGLIACYAGSSATSGVNFIHGWADNPGAPNNAQVRDVSMFSVTCSDPSAPYFLNTGDCQVGATVNIDFGFPGDPVPNRPVGIQARADLHASANCGGSGDPLTWVSTDPVNLVSTWSGGAKTINAATGRNPMSISWQTRPGPGPGFSGCFPLAAVPYAADDASGPLEYVDISGADGPPYPPTIDSNSRNIGPDHNVIVTVGFNKPLQIVDPLLPPFLLRFASKSGSLNQGLNCDYDQVFEEEVANGCLTTYRVNYYDWDNNPLTAYTWQDINCSAYPSPGDLPPPAHVNTPNPNCVRAKSGDVISFTKGLESRFETPCTPNNWPTKPASPAIDPEEVDDFFLNHDFQNDKRYVTLVITDFTAFTGAPNDHVPVKYIAGFYATGWDISSQTTGCPPENDPHPLGLPSNKDNGDVWGHFVKIVVPSSTGSPSEQLCNFDEIGTCIAVLVE